MDHPDFIVRRYMENSICPDESITLPVSSSEVNASFVCDLLHCLINTQLLIISPTVQSFHPGFIFFLH